MSSGLTLRGSYTLEPAYGAYGDLAVETKIFSQFLLDAYTAEIVNFDDLNPVTLSLGDMTGANLLFITGLADAIKVTVTTSQGTSQIYVTDGTLLVTTTRHPITAVVLQRIGTSVTSGKIFLGHVSA